MRTLVGLSDPPLTLLACAPELAVGLSVEPLVAGQEAEALDFLAARPLHTVYMAGFIRDNGLVSALNRGTFYGCRDRAGRLVGLALIGHVIQLEARTDAALQALARAAQNCSSAHVIMGEQALMRAFLGHYAGGGQVLRRACRELLLTRTGPIAAASVPGLRRATAADLPLILPVQARMAVAECGIDPRAVDPSGFSARCARRIARGRIWVLLEAGRLVFKADIMAETPQAVYIEGVHVASEARGRGLGRRCLLRLGAELLARSRGVCLLVNEQNRAALAFYYKAGYRFHSIYDTVYLYKSDI